MKKELSRKTKVILLSTALAVLAAAALFFTLLPAYRNAPNTKKTVLKIQAAPVLKDYAYSVTMSPVGKVYFRKVPEKVVTLDANYNDMLVAVGQGQKLIATGYATDHFDGFYEQLPGLQTHIDWNQLVYLNPAGGASYDKELLYQLGGDIHHIDPLQMIAGKNWTIADIEEIAQNVGPFFANRYSREYEPGKKRGEQAGYDYEYYTLWELADKMGQVYQDNKKAAALKKLADKMTREIQDKLPPVAERPRVALIYYRDGSITTYRLMKGGFGQAQYVAVPAVDAFDESIKDYANGSGPMGTSLDMEGLLAVNPDVIIMPLAIYGEGHKAAFQSLVKMKDDPIAKNIAAFRNNHVYPGGTALQGPVFHIFQIEMAAKQIYPEIFGEYRNDQNYPAAEQLFNRTALAEILTGSVQS